MSGNSPNDSLIFLQISDLPSAIFCGVVWKPFHAGRRQGLCYSLCECILSFCRAACVRDFRRLGRRRRSSGGVLQICRKETGGPTDQQIDTPADRWASERLTDGSASGWRRGRGAPRRLTVLRSHAWLRQKLCLTPMPISNCVLVPASSPNEPTEACALIVSPLTSRVLPLARCQPASTYVAVRLESE